MSFSNLPAPVLAYIKASNGFDLGALVAAFSEEALVNDQQREYASLPAIRNWAAREIIGDRVTMDVTGTAIRGDNIVVTANMDGAYDKTGLPDPLLLTFYFSLSGDRIEQLIILHNKGSHRSGLVLQEGLLDGQIHTVEGLDVALGRALRLGIGRPELVLLLVHGQIGLGLVRRR